MEAACSSKILVTTYQITWYHCSRRPKYAVYNFLQLERVNKKISIANNKLTMLDLRFSWQ
jgi:hypothetical protein